MNNFSAVLGRNLGENFNKNRWQISLFCLILGLFGLSLPFKNAIYQISYILIDLFFICHIIFYKNFKILKEILGPVKPLFWLFVCFFIAIILANLLNPEFTTKKSYSNALVFVFRSAFIFLALAYFYRLKFFGAKFLVVAIFSGLILLSFTAIFEIIQKPQILTNVAFGLDGSLGSRTGFGLFMGLGFILSFTLLKGPLMPFLSLFFAFFTIFSFARSAWVAAAAATLIFIALNFKKDGKKTLIFALIFALFIALCYLFFGSFQTRFSDLIALNSSNRFFIWQYSLEMFLNSPIFGYGVGNFRTLPNSPATLSPDWNATHNLILETLLHTGILGAIFLFSMIFYNFYHAFKGRNFAIFAIFAYFFAIYQFDFSVFSKEISGFLAIFTFLLFREKFGAVK